MINLTDSLSACTASGILAYAKQIYQQMSGGTATNVEDLLNEHEAKIQSAIKLDEYNEVNITYPIYEEGGVGSILCNLVKDDDKIIQDHSDWGSEFADYVGNSHLYIGTNFGNSGIGVLENDDFLGYEGGEEIVNVTDSNDKSTIANCIKSPHGYWIIQTESELTASNNLYSSIGNYRQKRDFTPFSLEADGSLYLMGVGGYNGDESIAYQSKSLQEVLDDLEEQIASASASTSGVTVIGKKVLLGNPNNYTVSYDCINIGSNSANTFDYNNIVIGYGLDTWGGNVKGVNIFGKWNTTNGWNSSTYPVLVFGTGNSSSRETALAYFNKNGNSKWYLKGIGYNDASGFTANGNTDLKSYIDAGANILAPDDIVDYFALPFIKVGITIDETGNTIITSSKQCESLPIDEESKYYIGSVKYMFSAVTPSWVDNNDGTYTYTLPASTTHPENYTGSSQYIAIKPTNFYVEGGITYRVLYTVDDGYDGHAMVQNIKTISKNLARIHNGSGGNRHKPEGMVYNPNCADWYELTAGQLSMILANS